MDPKGGGEREKERGSAGRVRRYNCNVLPPKRRLTRDKVR